MSNQPLETKWQKLFREPPEVVTAFSAGHVIYLKNTVVEGYSLSKSDLINDKFENVIFKDARFQRGTLTNVLFTDGSMDGTSFWGSTLTNVIFENLTIVDSVFAGATLVGVTFKNCKIYNSKIHSLSTSKILIEDSELSNVEFFDSELDITLKNTRVIELGMFGGLKPGSRVRLENSYIGPYSDFSYSNITSFKAVRSELVGFSLGDTTGQVDLISSKLDFNLGHGYIKTLNVDSCEIKLMSSSKGATFDNISIENCINSNEVFFVHANINKLNMSNCNLNRFGPIGSKIIKANIANSSFFQTDADDIIVKELTFHNLNFNGETIFKGAQADDSELFKVSFGPDANLDATGSNIPFQR